MVGKAVTVGRERELGKSVPRERDCRPRERERELVVEDEDKIF